VEVFLEGFPGLGVRRLVCYVWIVLVAGALIVLGAVRLPVPKAHPAEVVLTTVALHVVAAAVLLDANMALWALQSTQNFMRLPFPK
jgi:hypothetical protein